MMEFKISSFCTGGGCVEVGHSPGATAVRDSKDPSRAVTISVSPAAWNSFLEGVKTGDWSGASTGA
jgi:hypothetical protein